MPEVIAGTQVTTTPGYIVVEIDGKKIQYPIRIRLEDVPVGLTYIHVGAIKTLANLMGDFIKKLIALEILDPEFTGEDGYDLAAVIQSLERMGCDFGEIDLAVT